MQFEDMDVASVDYVLSTTRSVRYRLDLDRPVPREVIVECLDLSQQAPTGGNSQNWRWIVVTDAAVRAEVAAIYRRCENGLFERQVQRYTESGQPDMARVYDAAGHLRDVIDRVPVHVFACARAPKDISANVIAGSVYGSIYPAAWSFMLALRSRGLGSVLTTLHLMAEDEMAELLGIPEGYRQVGLIPVAYTKGLEFSRAKRPPVDSIVSWDHWSES
ncbi:MAG: nitroreductase family protein [Acidimicrobiia bacterium]